MNRSSHPLASAVATVFLVLSALLATASCGVGQQPSLLDSSPRGSLGGTLRAQPANEAEMELRMSPIVRAVQSAQDSVVCVDLLSAAALASNRGGGQVRPQGQGSGVILDAEGLVITNWHVVAPVAGGQPIKIQVRLHDTRQYMARLLSSSPEHDLALLQMELPPGDEVVPARLGDSTSLMVGETLIAIGNPQGHAHTVTSGVLSAIDREITVRTPDRRARTYAGLLQTDAAINQGNSGGALLDITGRLIGINNAMAMGSENIGFAIPVNTMREVFEDVLLNSRNLASTFSNVVVGFRAEVTDTGLMIAAVDADSPADLAGLRKNDLLRSVGERDVRSPIDLARTLVAAKAGEPMAIGIDRGGASRELELVPIGRGEWMVRQLVGLEIEEVADDSVQTAAARGMYGDRARSSYNRVLRVTDVVAESTAEEAGLKAGDLLIGVKIPRRSLFQQSWVDVTVESAEQLNAQLRPGAVLPIIVLRNGKVLEGPLYVPKRS